MAIFSRSLTATFSQLLVMIVFSFWSGDLAFVSPGDCV